MPALVHLPLATLATLLVSTEFLFFVLAEVHIKVNHSCTVDKRPPMEKGSIYVPYSTVCARRSSNKARFDKAPIMALRRKAHSEDVLPQTHGKVQCKERRFSNECVYNVNALYA